MALAPGLRADCGAVPGNLLLPGDKLNTYAEITTYNNFYEYSPDKRAVAILAQNLRPRPWSISIEGELERPRVIDVDQLVREHPPQERVYRLRCIEGWSMVIPWEGIPLCQVLGRLRLTSRARYVEFVSLYDPTRLYGQRRPTLPWPYTEGLTIAEAMHPLTLLATGLYGKPLPNQNGAPVRLVVPWKYGFKSIKSIVTIGLRERQPLTTWPQVAGSDYGFYGNVNPRVAGARGTQSRETRIGELRKRETLLLNGYAAQVSHLYAGLDLDSLL
jgi:sulfoxide reductase catalytic subunit YedY